MSQPKEGQPDGSWEEPSTGNADLKAREKKRNPLQRRRRKESLSENRYLGVKDRRPHTSTKGNCFDSSDP